MKTKMWLSCLAAGAAFAVCGGEVIEQFTDGAGDCWKGTQLNTTMAKSGSACMQTDLRPAWLYSPKAHSIDPAKKYRFKIALKTIDPATVNHGYVGIAQYDANNRAIFRNQVQTIPGTAAKLAAPAAKGDTELRITGADWSGKLSKLGTMIAFNAKEDFSDLPNRRLSPQIKSVKTEGDVQVVTLSKPLAAAYPVDTPVRLHEAPAGHSYGLLNANVPAEWKEIQATVTGRSQNSGPYTEFWPGAESFRVIVVVNYNPKLQSSVLIDDLSVEVEDAE